MTRCDTHRPVPRPRFAIALLLGASGLFGCAASFQAIDAHTRQLMDERSSELGGGAIAPQRIGPRGAEPNRRRELDPRPGSVNPGAADLDFDQARADREVAARLQTYTDEALGGDAAERAQLGLAEALRIAQDSGREYRSAEESYILAAISLLIERHQWGPRLFDDAGVTLSGSGDSGSFDTALDLINELRVTQRLPFGGDVEARWLVSATQDLRRAAGEEYIQSSQIVLSGDVPLLRGAGNVARESLIQAERDLVYAAREFERFRREYLVSIANDYFSLLTTQARIESQRQQIASQQQSFDRTRALVEDGELRKFQESIAENGLRSAESSLASLNQSYVLQIERFLIRLGLDPSTPVLIAGLELNLPEPEVQPTEASNRALNYRLDLQNRRDQLDDSRRRVANAQDDLLPDLNLNGRVTIPTDTDDDVGGLGFDPGDASFSVGATLSLPLDRRIERLNLRRAQIALERSLRDYAQFRDNVIIDARASVREIELARFRLQLAERQVAIAEARQEQQTIDPAGVTAQEELDTSNDLLNARNERDDAISDLRSAILEYLLVTGQLRVAPDGTLVPLPGMGEG
ncbi:MAG: TolC family protein [Phycisphaeraceae bacterium]|nr:TolC family protein [Phycisphaeraceae bacterium]